jgi:membrane-associated phospholipid phosphatase
VKQHYLADVAGGLVLAGVISAVVMRVTRAR